MQGYLTNGYNQQRIVLVGDAGSPVNCMSLEHKEVSSTNFSLWISARGEATKLRFAGLGLVAEIPSLGSRGISSEEMRFPSTAIHGKQHYLIQAGTSRIQTYCEKSFRRGLRGHYYSIYTQERKGNTKRQ